MNFIDSPNQSVMFQALNVAPPPPITDDEVTQPHVLAARKAEGIDYLKRARYEEGMGRCTKQDVDEAGNYLMGTIVASTIPSIQRVLPNIAAQQIAAILLPQLEVQMQQLQNQNASASEPSGKQVATVVRVCSHSPSEWVLNKKCACNSNASIPATAINPSPSSQPSQ